MRYLILFGLIFLFPICTVTAQNLAAIGNQPALKVSGGISANQIFYAANGINNRRDPYSYFLTGNLNFNIYELNIPISFNLSNQNISVQQPFNNYSLHPVYKWVTGHLGFTSMTFSPYTLNGHIFRGAGIDATPNEKLRISAMYGRLLRAVEVDTLIQRNQPSFARYGYGLKTRYGSQANFFEITVFRAKDDVSSLSAVPEKQNVLPLASTGKSLTKYPIDFWRLFHDILLDSRAFLDGEHAHSHLLPAKSLLLLTLPQ